MTPRYVVRWKCPTSNKYIGHHDRCNNDGCCVACGHVSSGTITHAVKEVGHFPPHTFATLLGFKERPFILLRTGAPPIPSYRPRRWSGIFAILWLVALIAFLSLVEYSGYWR